MSEQFRDDTIYHLLLEQALGTYRLPMWHLIIDRSNWIPQQQDLLMVSLSYHKRAIPIAWQIHDFGPTNAQEQMDLLERVWSFMPQNQPITLHGDAEFGSVPLMRFITRQTNWDFILGQRSRNQFHVGDWQWQVVKDLHITPSRPYFAANIFWTKTHNFGPLNFFAFYKPYRSGRNEPQKMVRYCLTSLPIAPHLRRLGHRRWGCEPMFRDFKSSAGIGNNLDYKTPTLVIPSCSFLASTIYGQPLWEDGCVRLVVAMKLTAKKTALQLISYWLGLAHSSTSNGKSHPNIFKVISMTSYFYEKIYRLLPLFSHICVGR